MWSYISSLLFHWHVAGVVCSKTIRDKIIPHAVSLFTGEAVERGTECEDLDDDDDDLNDDDYHSDEDEEEEEEEAVERGTKFKVFYNDDELDDEDSDGDGDGDDVEEEEEDEEFEDDP